MTYAKKGFQGNVIIATLGFLLLICTYAHPGGITDPKRVVKPAALPLQPSGKVFTDPAFNTKLRRITADSNASSLGTHIYSQLQAFSSDNRFVLLIEGDWYTVRRVDNLSLVMRNANWNAPRWYPAQAHTIIHYDTNADTVVRVQLTNMDTKTTSTIFAFPRQYQRVMGNQSFDELSRDGRWMSGMVRRNDDAAVIFAFDTMNRRLTAMLPLPDLYGGACRPDPQWGQVEPDWVGVSPLGRYLVVQWIRDGTARCSGLETFNLEGGSFVGRVHDSHDHGDLGVDVDGTTEFFMTGEYHPSGNPAIGIRKLPGTATVSPKHYVRVVHWGDAEHISCQGPNGVCVITNGYATTNTWRPLEGEIMLLRTNGSVLRLAHHRSSDCGYWVQPRASISLDGRYVIFASDWGRQTGQNSCGADELGRGDAYLIDLQE